MKSMKELSEDPRIASLEEVLRYYSAVMRNQSEEGIIASTRLKAAELLGKWYWEYDAPSPSVGTAKIFDIISELFSHEEE
jgi:hypothetical protein